MTRLTRFRALPRCWPVNSARTPSHFHARRATGRFILSRHTAAHFNGTETIRTGRTEARDTRCYESSGKLSASTNSLTQMRHSRRGFPSPDDERDTKANLNSVVGTRFTLTKVP